MSISRPDRIVIRRKKVVGAARRGGSWKIAYADFMTAMMAFFLVLWVLSLVPRDELSEIADYFRMPLLEAVSGGMRADHARNIIPGGSPSAVPSAFPLNRGDPDSDRRDVERLHDLKDELDGLIQSDPVLNEFREQLLLDMTPDGLRIQIVDKQNRPMFAMGSASIQPYMRNILSALSNPLNKMPNSLQMAGHTDSFQYASGERQYSNWELSADRANAARQELVAGGLAETKIRQILGLSSTISLVKDNPAAAVNRRISIVVLNQRAERRLDEQYKFDEPSFNLRDSLDFPEIGASYLPTEPISVVSP